MKNYNTVLNIVLIAIFLVVSALASIPLTRFMEVKSVSFINRYILSLEEILGSDISFNLQDKDILRHVKLNNVVIQDKSVSRNIIADIDELTIEYDLIKLLFKRNLDTYTIKAVISNMSGNLNESEIKRIISQINTGRAFSDQKDNQKESTDYFSQLLPKLLLQIYIQNSNINIEYGQTVSEISDINLNIEIDKLQFQTGYFSADFIETEIYNPENPFDSVGTLLIENTTLQTLRNDNYFDFNANIFKTNIRIIDNSLTSVSNLHTITLDGAFSVQDVSLHHINLTILDSESENKDDANSLLIKSGVLDVTAKQKSFSNEVTFNIASERLFTELKNLHNDVITANLINADISFDSTLSIPTEIPALIFSFKELALFAGFSVETPDLKEEQNVLHVSLKESNVELFKNPTRNTYNILLKTDSISSDILVPGLSLSGNGLIETPTILLETKLNQFIDISFLSEVSTFSMLLEDTEFALQANASNMYVKNSGRSLSGTLSSELISSLQLENHIDISSAIDVKADYDYDNQIINSDLQLNSIYIDNKEFLEKIYGSVNINIPNRLASGNLNIPGLTADLKYSSAEKDISANLNIDNLSIDTYKEQISRFIDFSKLNFLTGSIFDAAISLNYRFPEYDLTYIGELSIKNLFINANLPPINFETGLDGNRSDISIHDANIFVSNYIISLGGTFDMVNRIPAIEVNIFSSDTEPKNFSENEAYDILPIISAEIFGNTLLDGEIAVTSNLLPEGSILSHYSIGGALNSIDFNGEVQYRDLHYPIVLNADLNTISLTGIGGDQKLGFAEFSITQKADDSMKYSGSLTLNNQHLPDTISTFLSQLSFDAAVNFQFNDLHDWIFNIENADIENIVFGRNFVTLNLDSVQIIPDLITIKQLKYTDSVSSLAGEGEIRYKFIDDLSFESLIDIKNDNEQVKITLNKTGKAIKLTADISGGRLLHAPIDIGSGIVDGSVTLTGYKSEFNFTSDLSIRNGLMSQKHYAGRVLLLGNEQELKIENFSGEYDGSSVQDFSLKYNFISGLIESSSFQQLKTKNGMITFNLDLKSEVQEIYSIFDVSIDEILNQNLVIYSTISDIHSNGISLLEDFTAIVEIANGSIGVEGGPNNSIKAEISKEGYVNASVGQNIESSLPFSFSLTGSLKNGLIGVNIENIQFDLTYLNSILRISDYLHFETGDLYGNMRVTGSLKDPDFFGELFCDYIELTSLLLPEKVKAENISASISEKALYFVPFYAEIDNKFSEINMQMDLEYLIPYYYDIEINIPEKGRVQIKNNFSNIGLVVDGMISGLLNFKGAGPDMLISGNLKIDDAAISLDPKGKSQNLAQRGDISANLALQTGNNVKAILPNLDFPIISATISENQKLNISYNGTNKNYQVSSDMKLLGGEIFYFQRSFFITSGLLKMNENHLNKFDPLISIEAKLRDFDKNGEKIDIFLKIQNNPISNFTPVLSSRPAKSVAEIAEILGQNILPGDLLSGTNLSSALALATIATDVIQQLGFIELDPISDFENIVRNTFQLDLFSIRTQVFQNIILETLANSQLKMLSLNPIARYLDNTTVFLGKYINNDVFLQAMLHLTANDNYGPGLFMTDDLKLDVELSIEWENPLYFLRVSTQPEGLQPYQLLDALTIGVSWSFSF